MQWTNCHPFRHGRWLWMHNGSIAQFQELKRELQFAVDPSLYSAIEGSTDSETFFYLALTFGLEDDPPAAVARAVGLIEHVGHKHGIEHPIQMTVATSDSTTLWAFRYSSEGTSRSLFYSTKVSTLRELYPDLEALQGLTTRRGSSSPSRFATSPAPGTKCRRRATASCSPARTSSTHSSQLANGS